MTRGELAKTITRDQRDLLQKLFGTGPQGARDALAQGAKIPEGLARETLETYRQIAQKSINEGIDKIGTQAERLKLLDELLK